MAFIISVSLYKMAESYGSKEETVEDLYEQLDKMMEDEGFTFNDKFIEQIIRDFKYCWFDFEKNYACVTKIMDEKKKRGENPNEDIMMMIYFAIEKGNKISSWIRSRPKPLQQKVLTLRKIYNIKDKTDNCRDLTLERVCYLFPLWTSKAMRNNKKHILADINLKNFVPHIDDAVMHQAFNLIVPKSLKKILDLTKVLNALRNKKTGRQETIEKPLHELIDQCNNFVEKLFENDYCNEEIRRDAMQNLGFCKVEVFVPTRDFVAMILEGSKLYETIKTEKWTSLPDSNAGYKMYSKEELEEKIAEFLNTFKANK